MPVSIHHLQKMKLSFSLLHKGDCNKENLGFERGSAPKAQRFFCFPGQRQKTHSFRENTLSGCLAFLQCPTHPI